MKQEKCSRCKRMFDLQDLMNIEDKVVCVECHAFDEYGVIL